MTKKLCIRTAVISAFVGILGASGVAAAQVAEVEPNDSTTTAQHIPSGSAAGVTISGEIISSSDVDFYSFHAEQGDVIKVDTRGMTTDLLGLHSTLTILGPLGTVPLPALPVTKAKTQEEGSMSIWDARIDNFPILRSGTYVVAIAGYPLVITQNETRTTLGTPDDNSHGSYTLIISGATPDPVKIIGIDIKPGDHNTSPAPINLKSGGSIGVALLSAPDFDPFQVKQDSLRFGHAGTEISLARCRRKDKDDDFNKDGKPDLVCQFYIQSTMFLATDTVGVLTGQMLDGTQIEGQGSLKVIPADERHHHGDHDRDDHDKGDHDKDDHGKGKH